MRKVIGLLQGWQYCDNFSEAFLQNDFDGYAWQEVTLPHANKEIPYNYFDERDYQFVSTYRRELDIDPSDQGKRLFLDFEGVMAAAEVYLNQVLVGSHRGGYTPFSCEITHAVNFGGENQLVVVVDSTERPDIPPFGHVMDYLCYGGIYREVNFRAVDPIFIENVFAKPKNVLTEARELEVDVYINNPLNNAVTGELQAVLSRGGKVVAQAFRSVELTTRGIIVETMRLTDLAEVELWDLDTPNLYQLIVSLRTNLPTEDSYTDRIGFREAVVRPDGFFLNGRRVKIRGLNRHQAWPYVGYAMPKRAQRDDADILKYQLHLNTVRTSHYPQSRHFLDRCDEIGLLVIEEIPGWQHIGDAEWKKLACSHVREMIQRDWNHPSVILWGVRINESRDDHDFYTETNRIARELDPTRQTCGVRFHGHSEFLEDVYTMNDFAHSGGDLVLRDQRVVTGLDHYVPYIVTEYNGHMYPTKRFDHEERLMEHALRHMRVLSAAGLDPHIAGTVGWCAFDYNTHYQFGSGDRICYHGVMDMFRIPKFAADAYRSQVDPETEVVLSPVTLWARGERSIGGVFPLVVFTNCDCVEIKVDGQSIGKFFPDRLQFPGVKYPPVVIRHAPRILGEWGCQWYDGEIIGYVNGKAAAVKKFIKNPVASKLEIKADHQLLDADGSDVTRVVFRIVDQVGNVVPYINDFISIEVDGPGEVVGPKQVVLIGGCIAAWIKTKTKPGTIKVWAVSSRFVSEEIEIISQ